MSREDDIIKRIRESLLNDGIKDIPNVKTSKSGIGSAKSYFDALVDRRLEGKGDPTAQEVWEEMKSQINFLTNSLVKASVDYSKLETKLRGAMEDNRDLLREKFDK